MLKKLITFLLVFSLLLSFTSCPQNDNGGTGPGTTEPGTTEPGGTEPEDTWPQTMSGKTASVYFRDNNIRAGWNIGNSLDSHNNGVAGETLWVSMKINQALLDSGKNAGFDIVRIPVTWMGHIGNAPDYTVSKERLDRVAEVVGYAKKAGLKAVVINLHHDGSTDSASKEAGWLSIRKSLANPAEKQAITTKFTKVWEQIAEHFKEYGDYLIFEAFNELHDGGWFWASRNVPQDQLSLVSEWSQIFVDTVRASGGNNETRYLIIPGYCTGAEITVSDSFSMPNDSAENRLIVTFHYYRPDGFALNGSGKTWDTTGARSEINNLFGKYKTKFINNNIPVIIGETGPVRNRDAAGDANRILYINFLYGQAKNNGLVPIYWDNGSYGRNGDGFGIFSRLNGGPYQGMNEVIQAMVDAVK
jgi:endoglucanase